MSRKLISLNSGCRSMVQAGPRTRVSRTPPDHHHHPAIDHKISGLIIVTVSTIGTAGQSRVHAGVRMNTLYARRASACLSTTTVSFAWVCVPFSTMPRLHGVCAITPMRSHLLHGSCARFSSFLLPSAYGAQPTLSSASGLRCDPLPGAGAHSLASRTSGL